MTATLPLSPDELLTTTRAVRKRLDFARPVELGVVRECLEIALQAPTGSNAQGWQWMIVTDPAKRLAIAELYRKAWAVYPSMPASAHQVHASDPSMTGVQAAVVSSAEYLAANLERAPVFLIPCIAGRVEGIPAPFGVVAQASTYGSVLPAVWSFMLAARARARYRLDNPASHARGSRGDDPRHPLRRDHAVRADSGRIHAWHRVQSRAA